MFSIRALSKSYARDGRDATIFRDVAFDVRPGEFVSIIGPSGCGKTTLLRCLAGLDAPGSGAVRLDGAPVDGPGAGVVMVFQDAAASLFPWKTVFGNVAFGAARGHPSRSGAGERTRRLLADVGLSGFGDYHPWQVSGGMQQRAAMARALACEPGCLLMDEPFASLDAQARAELEDLLLSLWADRGMTVLFVTHDVDEAIYLSDRILILGGSPAAVRDDVAVDLPRPRHQVDTRGLPRFSELRSRIHAVLTGGGGR
ncbi:MAG: ABC transporter ATP-binding protein [Pseudodesulfovibrio sp.]